MSQSFQKLDECLWSIVGILLNFSECLLTGECAHDFALQFFGYRVTELSGNISCYILCYRMRRGMNSRCSILNGREKTKSRGWCNIIPMRWSFNLSSTDSMSSRVRLLDPTRPFSIPNMPPMPPPFLGLKSTQKGELYFSVHSLPTQSSWSDKRLT